MILNLSLWILFGGAIVYSCLLYAYLGWQLRADRQPAQITMRAPEGSSIIVCAHNEHQNLKTLLPLLLQQQHPRFEVVVADDASSDGTAQFLRAQQKIYPKLSVVTIEERPAGIQPKKHALQLAIGAARYDQLVLTDADCRPASAQWLSRMVQPLRGHTQVVLGYSPYLYGTGWLNRFIAYETLHTGLLYIGSARAGRPYMGVGRNLAYRKTFFDQGQQFRNHQAVVGGDDDLWVNEHAGKSNTEVALAPEALVYSVPETSLGSYFRQKTRHLHAGQHYSRRDKLWLGTLSLSTIAAWMAGILLLVFSDYWPTIVGLFLLRWLILAAGLHTAGRRLHSPINLRWLPILDFLHVIYYIVIGIRAFATTNISWKN
jgi:cellulose synthase/poly-beta-1,6-N-acetylglucosamine synthase-like glycosyltransferase